MKRPETNVFRVGMRKRPPTDVKHLKHVQSSEQKPARDRRNSGQVCHLNVKAGDTCR